MESAYMKKARQAVVDYLNARVDKTDGKTFDYDETFVVWFSKTLQKRRTEWSRYSFHSR